MVSHTKAMLFGLSLNYNPRFSIELPENHILLGLEGHFEVNYKSFLSYFLFLLNFIIKFVSDLMKGNISLYSFS